MQGLLSRQPRSCPPASKSGQGRPAYFSTHQLAIAHSEHLYHRRPHSVSCPLLQPSPNCYPNAIAGHLQLTPNCSSRRHKLQLPHTYTLLISHPNQPTWKVSYRALGSRQQSLASPAVAPSTSMNFADCFSLQRRSLPSSSTMGELPQIRSRHPCYGGALRIVRDTRPRRAAEALYSIAICTQCDWI